MKISTKLNELKPIDLNCNVFDVYNYDGLSMQELLCQFFTKINECIKVSNETIDLASWLVNEGLEIEVVKKLMLWLNDGTLENLINVNLFNTLNNKIDNTSSKLENDINEFNKEFKKLSSSVFDYNNNPQGTKPSKSGACNNSFKIIHKTSEDQLTVVQNTNKGQVKYILEQNNGSSVENRDYGVSHELLRLVGAYPIQSSYLYYDVSNPFEGSFDGVLYQPSKRNEVEQLLSYSPNVNDVNSFGSKANGLGLGCYKLLYDNQVSYNLEVTQNNKCNIMFIGTSTSSNNIEVYVNDLLVKTFNPQSFKITSSYNGIGIVEFDIGVKSTTNSTIKVTIKNASNTGYFNLCALNYKILEEYNGEFITDYKCIGSNQNGWITNPGASDYALYDADTELWFGSYHGGETLLFQNIEWCSQRIQENNFYIDNKTMKDIVLDDWRIQKTFKIYQNTNLINKANMVSLLDFNVDGCIDMDFSYNGNVNLSNFYTAITCTDVNFNYVFFPKFYMFSDIQTGNNIEFELTEGKLIQVNSKDKLQLESRFTKFNHHRNSRRCVIADSPAYKKHYYGVIYGESYNISNLTFSKSLDFIVR